MNGVPAKRTGHAYEREDCKISNALEASLLQEMDICPADTDLRLLSIRRHLITINTKYRAKSGKVQSPALKIEVIQLCNTVRFKE